MTVSPSDIASPSDVVSPSDDAATSSNAAALPTQTRPPKAEELDALWPEASPPLPPTPSDLSIRPTIPVIRPTPNFFRRNAGLILGVGVFTAFWLSLYAWTVYTPRYAAKSTVIIKDSAITSRYVEPQQNYALQTTTSSSSNPVLNTMALLKSKAVSEALWEYMRTRQPQELKHNRIKTQREWNIFFQDGSSFIKAKNQPGTDLIAIQFSWRRPLVAKEGLEAVVEAFQESSRDLNKLEESSRTRFLGRQVTELEAQLKKIRHLKSTYRSRAGTVSMPREQDELAASRINLSNRLSEIEALARGKETQAGIYQRMLGLRPEQAMEASAIGQNGSMAKLQDELYRLRQLYSLLNASLTENNPKVREVQAQIDQVSANIEAERNRTLIRGGRSGVVADSTRVRLVDTMLQAQGEARELRAQASVIRSRLTEIVGEIRKYPSVAEELSDLEQRETSLSLALDQLRQKVIEGRIKEEQTLSNVFVVDAPRLPDHAQFPTPVHLTIIGIILGLGTGVAVAFLRERIFPGDSGNAPSSPWLETLEPKTPDENESGVPRATSNPSPDVPEPEREPAPVTPIPSLPPAERGVSIPPTPVVGQGGASVLQPAPAYSLYDTLAAAPEESDRQDESDVDAELAACGSRIRPRIGALQGHASKNPSKVRVLPPPSPETIRPLFQSILPASRWSYEWPSSLPAMHAAEPLGVTTLADNEAAPAVDPNFETAVEPMAAIEQDSLPVTPEKHTSTPTAIPDLTSARPPKRRLPAFLMQSPSIGKRSSINHPLPSAADSLIRAMQTLTAQPLTLQPQ